VANNCNDFRVVVPERAAVNIVYHSLNADTSGKSARTIKKLPYTRNLANWFSGKFRHHYTPDSTVSKLFTK